MNNLIYIIKQEGVSQNEVTVSVASFHDRCKVACRAFSLTWLASMLIYWNKRKHLRAKELNSQRIFLVHQHGCRFIVLKHHYGRRDVM